MSSPSPSTAVARPDLRGAVYRDWDGTGQRMFYIADRVCPQLDMDDEAGNIKRIPKEEELSDPDTLRQGDGGYTRSDFKYDDFPYSTVERGHEVPIDASKKATAAKYFDAEQVATDIALTKVHRDHEMRVATLYQTSGNWADTSAASDWTDHSSAVPITNVRTAKEAVYAACGMRPNTMVVPWLTYVHLLECDQILDRLGAQSSKDPKIANPTTLSQLFDLDHIVVPMGLKNTEDKGQTAALSQIWTTGTIWVGYVNPSPNPFSKTAAVNYHWKGDGSQYQFRVERYWEERIRKWCIRARRQVKPTIIDNTCGYVLTGANG